MQEMQRSACAVFGRVSLVKKGQNKTKTRPTNNQTKDHRENPTQETLENTLECTCMGEKESETDVGQ